MTSLPFDEIPNFNDPKYEKLLQSICHGTCIFIGAGVSNVAGYRLWDELREAMVKYFWSNKDRIPQDWRVKFDLSFCDSLKKHDILDSFELLSIVSRDLFVEGIKAIFEKDAKGSNDTIFHLLGRVSVIGDKKNIFVTTNLDKGLQEALIINDADVSIFPLLDNPPKYLSYVQGRIDVERSWILTTSQYHHGYVMDGAPCVEFLRYIFETYNVVFIG